MFWGWSGSISRGQEDLAEWSKVPRDPVGQQSEWSRAPGPPGSADQVLHPAEGGELGHGRGGGSRGGQAGEDEAQHW